MLILNSPIFSFVVPRFLATNSHGHVTAVSSGFKSLLEKRIRVDLYIKEGQNVV